MNIAALPFNRLVGIKKSEHALLTLPFSNDLLNHLGTIHAGAIYSLAEAASGEFLIKHREGREDIGGVVRKAASKYSAAARSALHAVCETDPELVKKAIAKIDGNGRVMITIPISVLDANDILVGKFTFDWLLSKEQ